MKTKIKLNKLVQQVHPVLFALHVAVAVHGAVETVVAVHAGLEQVLRLLPLTVVNRLFLPKLFPNGILVCCWPMRELLVRYSTSLCRA